MIADELRKLFTTPFMIQGHEIHLTISIGIVLFPGSVSAEDLQFTSSWTGMDIREYSSGGIRTYQIWPDFYNVCIALRIFNIA